MNFKILGIEHVAIAVNDLEKPSDLFGNLLGINHTSTEEIRDQKVITDIFDTGSGKVELLKATSDDSPITKFLDKRGPGVHHIAFRVDNLALALEELSDAGVNLIDIEPRVGAEGMLIAFLHPKSTSGVLVELCQKP
jgi:methylmalonyl-CoA/ethylmalonyl-CoA epimerase